MSTTNLTAIPLPQEPPVRVFGFIDGFNLYHALSKRGGAANYADEIRFRQYKWLCLRTLISQFVRPTEQLAGVEYFTAYPNWPGSEEKKRRHETYVGAVRSRGVTVTFGEFKFKDTECRHCGGVFQAPVEKETDINIALAMLGKAHLYDKAILLTADSDQAPVIRTLRSLYPSKQYVSLAPIGRASKELAKACGERFVMTEQHLIDSQLPNPLAVMINGKLTNSSFVKPPTWSSTSVESKSATPVFQIAAEGSKPLAPPLRA